jgi:hypothetical protein
MIWTLVEPGVAIVASSLATIRPLLRAMKLRGFESTGRTGGTSGAMRSGTNRSAAGRMPGFGSDDLTSVDIELGKTNKAVNSKRSSMMLSEGPVTSDRGRPRPNPNQLKSGARLSTEFMPPDKARRSTVKSEVYIIEGDRTASEPWRQQNLRHVRSMSSDDMDEGLEATSQHSGRVGLGR